MINTFSPPFANTFHSSQQRLLCNHVASLTNAAFCKNSLHPFQPLYIHYKHSSSSINIIHPLQTLCNLCSRCSYFASTWRSSSRNTLLSWQTLALNCSRICSLCILHKQPTLSAQDPAVLPPQPDAQRQTGVRLLLLPVPDPGTDTAGSQRGPGPHQQLHLAL